MGRCVCVIWIALTLCAPAAAEPPLLDDALRAMESAAETGGRYGFTLRTRMLGELDVESRFAPEAGRDGDWSLTNRSRDDLNRSERRYISKLFDNHDADIQRVLRDRASLFSGEAKLIHEDANEAVFQAAAPIGDGAEFAEYAPSLKSEITVGKACVCILSHRLYSVESFKPAPPVRYDSFTVVRTFARTKDGGPFVEISTTQEIEGRAMFRGFQRTLVEEVTNITPVN